MIHDFSSFDGHCFWFCFQGILRVFAVGCQHQLVGFGLSQSLWVILLQLDCCFLSRWISYLPWTFDTLCPFGFWDSPLHLLSLPLLHLPALRGIWMGQPEPDPEVIELSLQLAGLSITVRVLPLVLWILFVNSPPASLASHGLPCCSLASVQSLTSSGDTRASFACIFPCLSCPLDFSGCHPLIQVTTLWGRSGQASLECWLLGTCGVREGVSSPNRTDAPAEQVLVCAGVQRIGLPESFHISECLLPCCQAGSVGLQQSATLSLRRRKQGSALRLRGYLTPRVSTRFN